MYINHPTKGNIMQKAKLFYSTKPRLFVANAYAAQIRSDISEKICTGFECISIEDFYEECSQQEFDELTDWNYAVFGEALCNTVDTAIDRALYAEETFISDVFSIEICESFRLPGHFWATFCLDDPEHKRAKLIREMKRNAIYY